MAEPGEAAAAAGMPTVAGTDDLRDSYKEHNTSRDLLAQHQTSGTHSATQITSGVLDVARVPVLPAAKVPAVLPDFTVTGLLIANNAILGGTQVTGDASIAGTVTAPDIYGRSVGGGGGYRACYVHVSGLLGYVPSARRMKKNIRPADAVQLARLLEATVVEYDYKAAAGGGHDVGLIADELHDLGLGAFVFYEDDGRVAGIHYERLTVPLLAIVQQLNTRLAAIEAKLEGSL